MENTEYEYKIILLNKESNIVETEKKINDMSTEGWSLVSVVEDRHYFKRPKSNRKVL